MRKTCSKCEQNLDSSDFYAHAKSSDGLAGKCKECAKAIARRNRAKRLGYYREYDRRRYQKNGRRGEATKEASDRAKRRWSERNPIKRKASQAVSNALRDGRLSRQPCCVCGATKAQAHHEDYAKPYTVIWLCSKHHSEYHRIVDEIAKAFAEAS